MNNAFALTIEEPVHDLWPNAHYAIDEDERLTGKDFINTSIKKIQVKSAETAPMLQFVQGNVWVWFKLDTDTQFDPQLEFAFPHLTAFDVFVYGANGALISEHLGLVDPAFNSNDISHTYPSVRLPRLTAGDTVVLRIQSENALRMPINIGERKAFERNRFSHMGIVFICLGILLALCAYNVIIYFSTGFIHYLFYCLNLVFLLIFFSLDLGLGRYFLPESHWINDSLTWALSVCLAFAMAILFARSFLRIPEFYPKWNMFYRVLIVLVVVDTIIILQGNFELGLGLYMLASMMYQGGVIASSIYVLKQGFKPARFFLLAWVFLAFGGIVYMWTLTGIIASSSLGQYSFLLGTVIEATLLSWALAELINKNKNDQIENERHYRHILNKTSKRLADALKLTEKHKKVRDIFLKQISHELKTPLNAIDHVLDNAFKGYELKPDHIKDAHHSSRLVSRYIDKLLLNTEMSATKPKFQQDQQDQQDINILLKNWYEDLQLECYQKDIEFEFRSNLSDWHRLHGPVRAVYLLATEIIYNVCEMDLASIELDLHFDESKGDINIIFNLHSNMKWQVATAEQMFVNPQDAIFVDEVVKLLAGTWNLEMVSPNIEGTISLPGFSASMKDMNEVLPKRVLVVEDNKVNQKVMASMLKRMGIEHDIANDGEEALKQQAENPCELILMDCQMPVMDGFDATLAMRRQEKRYQKPKIIAVSANSMEQDKTHCFAVGMDDFIAKPVRMDDLRNLLMRWSS